MDKPELNMVMSWLEGLAQDDWRDFHSDSEVQSIAKASLELLKEQETPILTIDDAVSELMDRHYDRLKEQEAVVHPEPSCEMTYITNCCCDLCGVQLIREDNFCRGCGKRIEWECR